MRPLANEVLQEIFAFTCGEDDLNSQIPNALGIAAVCGKWRQLAIARPGLWSSFKIDLYGHSSKLEVHLEAYLTRSGQHLLTMHIIADHIDDDDEHPLLTKLTEQSKRCQHLTFEANGPDMQSEPSFRSLRAITQWPILETLSGICTDPEFEFPFHLFPSDKLRTLRADSDLLLSPPPFVDGVTHLKFTPIPNNNAFEKLALFPNLQDLGVFSHLNDESMIAQDLHSSKHIPKLSSLEIVFLPVFADTIESEYGVVHDLLRVTMDTLTAPCLSKLAIAPVLPFSADPSEALMVTESFDHIHTFVKRSGCTLTVLVLEGIPISDKCVVDLLKHLGSLLELTLEDPRYFKQVVDPLPISKDLIESLHTNRPSPLNPSSTVILPKLCSLVLIVWSSPFPHTSFIDTISSRWIPGNDSAVVGGSYACLLSFELHLPEVNKEDYLPLEHFERLGMRTVVKARS